MFPQSMQHVVPAHVCLAKYLGPPEAHDRSPFYDLDVAIPDASVNQGDPGTVLSDISNKNMADNKRPPTSKYKGVSYHGGNKKWRATVYYGASAPPCRTCLAWC